MLPTYWPTFMFDLILVIPSPVYYPVFLTTTFLGSMNSICLPNIYIFCKFHCRLMQQVHKCFTVHLCRKLFCSPFQVCWLPRSLEWNHSIVKYFTSFMHVYMAQMYRFSEKHSLMISFSRFIISKQCCKGSSFTFQRALFLCRLSKACLDSYCSSFVCILKIQKMGQNVHILQKKLF